MLRLRSGAHNANSGLLDREGYMANDGAIEYRIGAMEKEVLGLQATLAEIRKEYATKQELAELGRRLDAIESRFARLEEELKAFRIECANRFAALEQRMTAIERRLETIENLLSNLMTRQECIALIKAEVNRALLRGMTIIIPIQCALFSGFYALLRFGP